MEIEEVSRRRRLVDEVGGEVEDMREELTKAITGSQGQGKNKPLPSPSAFDVDSPAEDGYAAFEQQRQVEIMTEQDEALDGVFKTVGNLRQQADVMGRELEEQGEMLDEVDTLTDKLGGKLTGGMKRLNTIVKKNEGMNRLAMPPRPRGLTRPQIKCQVAVLQSLYLYLFYSLSWSSHSRRIQNKGGSATRSNGFLHIIGMHGSDIFI